jgi:hypothetical protein
LEAIPALSVSSSRLSWKPPLFWNTETPSAVRNPRL